MFVFRAQNTCYSPLRKCTHRSTTSKPNASCARCDPSLSINASDAISRQPWARAQSSAERINSPPTPRFRNRSWTNQPSTNPTGRAGLHPSACERIPTSRKPINAPLLSSETRITMGRVPIIGWLKTASSSLRCSSTPLSGQSNARICVSAFRSESRATRTLEIVISSILRFGANSVPQQSEQRGRQPGPESAALAPRPSGKTPVHFRFLNPEV